MTLPLITGPTWLQVLVGAVIGLLVAIAARLVRRWLELRRMTARGDVLDRLAWNMGFHRLPKESDRAFRARMMKAFRR